MIGSFELAVVALIALLVFGPSQLPKLTKMLGESIKTLREGLQDGENDSKTTNM